MIENVSDSKKIKILIKWALTDKINNRDMFIKWMDYNNYYEER